MSVNKYAPHVFVIPEDDANRELANGFLLTTSVDTRRIQVLESAGGWQFVIERFMNDHIAPMERYEHRYIVLLIDLDNDAGRLNDIRANIPEPLQQRVFLLGVLSEPEELRADLNMSLEDIGLELGTECLDGDSIAIRNHALLIHNAEEFERLSEIVCPFLFP